MNNLNIEKHFIKNREYLPQQLAESLISNMKAGKIAVVANNPSKLMQATRQRWATIKETTDMPANFTATVPGDLLDTGVTFGTLQDFLRTPPSCRVLYITHPIEKQNLYMLTSWMPPKSLVVFYGD